MSNAPAHGFVPQFTIGDRLRKARESTGLDRQAFAAHIGIHRDTLAKYEGDQRTVRIPVISAWSMATGVDFDWLRNGNTPRPEGPGGGDEPPGGIEPPTYSLQVRQWADNFPRDLNLTAA